MIASQVLTYGTIDNVSFIQFSNAAYLKIWCKQFDNVNSNNKTDHLMQIIPMSRMTELTNTAMMMTTIPERATKSIFNHISYLSNCCSCSRKLTKSNLLPSKRMPALVFPGHIITSVEHCCGKQKPKPTIKVNVILTELMMSVSVFGS